MPPEQHCDVPGEVRQIRIDSKLEDRGCRTRLMELISVTNLPDPVKTLLCEFLMDCNNFLP